MAFLAGAGAGGPGPGSSPVAGPISTTGATLFVAVVVNISIDSTPTDSQSNTWVTAPAGFVGLGNSRGTHAWYCVAPSTSGSHTFTNPGGNFSSICVLAFSNTPGSDSPSDVVNGAGGTGVQTPTTTIQPGSLTPGATTNILVTYLAGDANATLSINSGFTIGGQAPNSGGNFIGTALAYLIQTTATAQNPTWTVGSNGQVIGAGQIEFIENGGGGPAFVAARPQLVKQAVNRAGTY